MRKILAYGLKGILIIFSIFYFTFLFPGCTKNAPPPLIPPVMDSTSHIDSIPGNNAADTFAIYSLIPDIFGECSSTLANGGTEVGRPFDASNYFWIYVNVHKKGYWSYPKTTLDGMTFQGSGYFADTGSSNIKLVGSGTPINTGNYDFPLNVGGVNCSFRDIVWPKGYFPPPDSSSALYYRIIVGNKLYYQDATGDNGYIAGSSVNGQDDVTLSGSIDPDGSAASSKGTEFAVTKGIMHNYLASSNSQFKSFFAPGIYTFTSPQNTDGFQIEWKDSTGNNWSTSTGSGAQDGSSMQIVSVTDSPDGIHYYIKVKLRFSCILYSEIDGKGVRLTNGEFNGYFGKF